MDTITRAIADRWTGAKCYLDGAPAKIVGRMNQFAGVALLDGGRWESVQYSWHAVNRVMLDKGGFFETR